MHIVGRSPTSVSNAVALLKSEYPDPALIVSGSASDVTKEAEITATLREVVQGSGQVDHIVYTAVDERIRGTIEEQDLDEAKGLFGVKFWGQVAVAKGMYISIL